MRTKNKLVPKPEPTLREKIRNMIRTTSRTYNGNDYHTTLSSIYFLMHGTNKQDIIDELHKWVDLSGVDDSMPIVLPAAFFK